MKRTMLSVLLTGIFLLTVSVGLAQDDLPKEIVFEQAGILPEGVEYDAEGERFLVGSLAQGTIFEVTDDGTIKPFIEDEDLVSTVGIEIDEANNRLLVTNSDSSVFFQPDAKGMAALAAYDLESGERLFYVDLGELYADGVKHFANDVAVDGDGNAYVTDSFSPVIYKVDAEGKAEVLVESEQFANDFIGLNGIEYIPDGYLLAAVTGSAVLFKVPLDDPEAISQVEVEGLGGIDGMARAEDGSLYAVSNGQDSQEIVHFTSDDDFATATIEARVATSGNATTVAVRGDAAYYVNAYLQNPAAEQYEIVLAEFEG